MPKKSTSKRAKKAKREGKSASTQAGEFVREEIHHVREGKHGARSTKQAIAIGLSKARRAGVAAKPSKGASKKVRRNARRELAAGKHPRRKVSRARSRASTRALEREGHGAASHAALAGQARSAAKKRSAAARSSAARKAARTRARNAKR